MRETEVRILTFPVCVSWSVFWEKLPILAPYRQVLPRLFYLFWNRITSFFHS